MPAGTSAAMFSGIAAANASSAAVAAHRAEISRCKEVISSFNSQDTSVGAAKDYAHCIDLMYPDPASGTEMAIFKIAFILALIGLIWGIVYTKRVGGYMFGNFIDYVLAALMGFICLPAGIGFVAGIIYGIYWLFT